jgi:predicted nucleotidyltransferase
MARYTVRVELHKADSDDYETLHEYMEEEGFLRYVTDDDGARHQLPTAEYNISSNSDKYAVLNRAKQAASRTGKRYMVLVTESNGRTWYNLPDWED